MLGSMLKSLFQKHKRLWLILPPALVAVMAGSCRPAAAVSASLPSATTNLNYYQVKGVVKELKPGGRSVVIKHEEVPNYMPAMTMPFDVRDTNELRGLQAGDAVAFRMVVGNTDAWIDQVKKLDPPPAAAPAARPAFRIVRDVDPLQEGDPLPEYHFTNELGQALSTSQFKGQALAFTFFFTKCPFPTYCPLMSLNFSTVQKQLQALPNAPTNWHLLTISFDPETDTPAVLKEYAERYQYNPKHWNFVTGSLIDVTALGEQVGLTFWRDPGTAGISHNLRTVVVDARGRVQKIIPENKWTGDQMVAEMLKAAVVR